MTEGTSQGLFIVVAIVIFGIFVSLSYVVFGKVLQPKMVEMFETALNIETEGGSEGTPETETPAPVDPEARVQFEDENLEFVVTATLYGFDTNLNMAAMEKASEDLGPDFNGSEEQLLPYIKEIRDEIFSDNPVTFEKIQELTVLDLSYQGVKSLKGIENATNLEELNLQSNEDIADLTPIKGLTKMKKLDLHSVKSITDLTPLKDLINLEELKVAYSDITDVTPLKNLTKLTSLTLQNLAITDITPLSKLTNLKTFSIITNSNSNYNYNNDVTDISILSNFKQLESISIGANRNLKDITPIIDLPKLKQVNLYDVPKASLKGFTELKARTEVTIYGPN